MYPRRTRQHSPSSHNSLVTAMERKLKENFSTDRYFATNNTYTTNVPTLYSFLCVCVCVRVCVRACVRARACACVCVCVSRIILWSLGLLKSKWPSINEEIVLRKILSKKKNWTEKRKDSLACNTNANGTTRLRKNYGVWRKSKNENVCRP